MLVDEIKKDPTNPNVMTLEQSNGLEKSMIQFGRLKYIVVDQNNVLIDGEHRLEVEKAIGTKEVQVIKVEIKDEIDRKIIRETLNQLHGEYDKQKQSNELALIFENQRLDELAELLAKPKEDLEKLITRYNPEIKFAREEDESKLPSMFDQPAFVKKGEIWQLGRHFLLCGDCTQKDNVTKLMQENKADLVFTDPPYGVNYADKNKFLNSIGKSNRIEAPIENDAIKDYYEFYKSFLELLPVSEYNSIYVTIAGMQLSHLFNAFKDLHLYFSQLLVWVKNNHVLGRTDYANRHELIFYGWKGKHKFYGDFDTTVWEIDKPLSNDLHPTMKPLELIQHAIKNSSRENDIVYDPFLGSGSTLIACEQTNRICYGMEIDEHYCSVIIKRWEEYTGQKAVKLQSNEAEIQ